MANFRLEDDTKERLSLLIKERFPWLLIGLIGGILATLLMSNFEETLSKNLSLAFFLPVIIYMSDAIGTQTENIYVRNLSKFKDNFWKYLGKEIFIGLSFGIIFGLLLGLFAKVWIGSTSVAIT